MTNRIQPVTEAKAQEPVKSLYSQLKQKIGRVPNIFLNMGNSTEALQAFLALSDLVEKSSLSSPLKSKIALITAQTNNCNYCLSAHSAIAKAAGLADAEIVKARKGAADDAKEKAILAFVKKVVATRGDASDEDVAQVQKAGVSDKELAEIVLTIALNFYTNLFNKVTGTPVDFPVVANL